MQSFLASILIIDHNTTSRKTAIENLSSIGFKVLESSNIDKGIELAIEFNPDFILLEEQVTDRGGHETCKKLKQGCEGLIASHVILLSDNQDEQYIEECQTLGASEHYKKPLEFLSLKLHLITILRIKKENHLLKEEHSLLELTRKTAKIAHLKWNLITNKQTWSDNIGEVLGLGSKEGMSIEKLCKHTGLRDQFSFNSIRKNTDFRTYEFNFRVKSTSDQVRHFKFYGEISNHIPKQPILFSTIQDITETIRKSEKIWQQNHFDTLTNLQNRNSFIFKLEHDIKLAHYEEHALAIMILDLDEFKNVNDSLGHDIGDALLIRIAKRLLKLNGENINYARLGGDEFAVLISNYKELQEVAQLAEKILIEISKPISLDRKKLSLTASIGIAVYPNDGETAGLLLKHADTAMYNAKSNGRNHYAFFDLKMLEQVFLRNQMEQNIRRALSKNEFSLVFQPLVHLPTGKINGIEALIRWFDPEQKKWISPNQFIPTAELSSLISEIDEWVMLQLFKQVTNWYELKPELTLNKISFNITGRTLSSPSFKHSLEKILSNQAYKPHFSRMALEITERTLFDADKNQDIFNDIRQLGMRIAIDDFGTGFSSLNSLANLPANDILKIDKSFIDRIDSNKKAEALIKGIISLANSLDIEVIAEGVETEEQFNFLQEAGCDYIQGYYISKGLEANAFCEFYDQYRVQ